MANLYLTEQGSVLRKTGDRLIVQKEGEVLLEVQCNKIDAILIFGNVQFTTQAVHEPFEHGRRGPGIYGSTTLSQILTRLIL